MPENRNNTRHWVVVPAAGSGRRMAGSQPKQYLPLAGLPVITHSLVRLHRAVQPSAIVVALRAGDDDWPQINKPDCNIITVEGGDERSDSVLNGLIALADLAAADDWVWVHDAARPCVRIDDMLKLKQQIRDHAVGGLLALQVTDTVKQADAQQHAVGTVDRSNLWRALTPQVFRYGLLHEALQYARHENLVITDDAQAVELSGHKPLLVEAHADNIKITRQEDLPLAELYLRLQDK